MASVLVSTVISDFKLAFPDCSDTLALKLFNQVHADLLEMLPLKVTQEDVSLTSADYEYSLNENTVKVWSADYIESATTSRRLIEVDYEAYNRETPGWRLNPTGTPSQFALWRSGVSLGLYLFPIPNVTTSSGYPLVRLDVSRVEVLTSAGYTPAGMGATDVYVSGMCKRYAKFRKRDQYKYFADMYTEDLGKERHTWEGRSVQTKPQLRPDWMPSFYTV